MTETLDAHVITAVLAPARVKPSNYPEPFASAMGQRIKRPLGDLFGLTNFGVNLVHLAPGGVSALHHQHARQDEFIYVLEGRPTLFIGAEVAVLEPGQVAGFAANGEPHHLENHTDAVCVILEVGDRTPGDTVNYPDDDLQAVKTAEGGWFFAHKDGRPY